MCILVDSHHESLSKGGGTVGGGVSWLIPTTSRSARVEGTVGVGVSQLIPTTSRSARVEGTIGVGEVYLS